VLIAAILDGIRWELHSDKKNIMFLVTQANKFSFIHHKRSASIW